MDVILYAKEDSDIEHRLRIIIKSGLAKAEVWSASTKESFCDLLRRAWNHEPMVVIAATARNELMELNTIKNLFEDLRTILVLPDRGDETIALGLKLYPNFFSYRDGNLADVSAVLKKCYDNITLAKV